MMESEVNPLSRRHLALSARFKAAWAFHRMLVGMHRMDTEAHFENRSELFQALFGRLRQASEKLHGATTGRDDETRRELAVIEIDVDDLCRELAAQDEEVSPSELRRFFGQVRSLDERFLIEVIQFYLEIQRGQEWPPDRLDKIDFLLSRLAEKIAGPDLQMDQRRLGRVLRGVLSSATAVEVPDGELDRLVETLQDLRSEIRWVKTFEDLSEGRLVENYRALKRDIAARVFHPRLLPLVIEVNSTFRRKVEELRGREELRLMDDYHEVSQLLERSSPQASDLQTELTMLQQRVERLREGTRSKDVRLSELVALGDALRDLASRLQARPTDPIEKGALPFPRQPQPGRADSGSMGLVPDFDYLQPDWGDLLKALSGLDPGITEEQAVNEASLLIFRLEPREVQAFRRIAGSERVDNGLEQFILAAAALRHRVFREATDLRGLLSQSPGSIAEATLRRAAHAARVADAYAKQFSHLTEQAVLYQQVDEARTLLLLQARLQRACTGLVILLPRLSTADRTWNTGVVTELASGERPS